MPVKIIDICQFSDMPDFSAKEFSLDRTDGALSGFVVKTLDACFAYENRCPHTGIELNWEPNRFLTGDNAYIICATHGALFRIHDGMCVAGPCLGRRLKPIELNFEHDRIEILSR